MRENILKDIYDSIIEEFQVVDFDTSKLDQVCDDPSNEDKVKDLFFIYINWRKRFISTEKREVIYSKELRDKLSHNKKLKKIVDKIEYKFRTGEDLTPFLSKMIVNKPFEPLIKKEEYFKMTEEQKKKQSKIKRDKDILLNHFNLQHLHLDDTYNKREDKGIKFSGTLSKDKKDNDIVIRSKELLILCTTRDKAYFINITDHELFSYDTFEIMERNFTDLFKKYKVSFDEVTDFTNTDSIDMITNGVIAPLKINGRTFMFNPIALDGSDFIQRLRINDLFTDINNFYITFAERYQKKTMEDINKVKKSTIPQILYNIKIKIKDGLLFFYDEVSNITIRYIRSSESKIKIGMDEKFLNKEMASFDFNS